MLRNIDNWISLQECDRVSKRDRSRQNEEIHVTIFQYVSNNLVKFKMFFSELSPIFQELVQQPMAFSGGFFSGLLKLKLDEDPLASWLEQQKNSR